MSEKTNYIEVEEYSQDIRKYQITSKNPIDLDKFSIVEALSQVDILKEGDTAEYETEDGNTIYVWFIHTEYGDDSQIDITHIEPLEEK